MILYQVQTTETTKDFTPCIFAETLTGIYCEMPNGGGFFKHPVFNTPAQLKEPRQRRCPVRRVRTA